MFGCVLVAWLTVAIGMPASTCRVIVGPPVARASTMPGDEQVWVEWAYTPIRGLPLLTRLAAIQVYVVAHELGHIRLWPASSEFAADHWARTHYCSVVILLGVARDRARPACDRLWRLLPKEWRTLGVRLHPAVQ